MRTQLLVDMILDRLPAALSGITADSSTQGVLYSKFNIMSTSRQ